MLTVVHWAAEGLCLLIILGCCTFLCAAYSSWRVNDAVTRALADDRQRVESCYRAGGWDESTPLYDQLAREKQLEAVDFGLFELEFEPPAEDAP